MIKNDRQYRITKGQVRTFENAIADLAKHPVPQEVDPALPDVQQRAMKSQVEEMISEVQEYEALKSGKITAFDAQSFDELPALLVKARIARGMTHKDLAERLNIREQQVQRWEANDYHGTNIENLKAIAEALGVVVTQHLHFSRAEAGALRESSAPYFSNQNLAEESKNNKEVKFMKSFTEIRNLLEESVPLPANLPVIYLFGDTGAGKTCFVRQLLGTIGQKFPTVRRLRTTVAPTEFVITNESEFKAVFVFKRDEEVAQCVLEILKNVVQVAVTTKNDGGDEPDLTDLLSESPDQRFKLQCFLDDHLRDRLVQRICADLVPKIRDWVKSNFSGESDLTTVIELALEGEFRPEITKFHSEIMQQILARVRHVCIGAANGGLPDTYAFSSTNRSEFVEKLKIFLGLDEGAISPVLEKARVRGNLKSPILPQAVEIVLIDGEGIGHDAREAKVLSARHFDYFYVSDSIILVEDSETPFTRAGKSALASIVASGYLPKLSVAFSRLDKVEQDTRLAQRREVNRSLRNVLSALEQDGISVEKDSLAVRYFSKMNEDHPDPESQHELVSLVESIIARHGRARAKFVAPEYDFELLAAFLANAISSFRRIWAGYILGQDAEPAKWQTQKAFTKRMDWRDEEYRFLKPVAELREHLILNLNSFLANPVGWKEEITDVHKKDCLERLRQEVSNQILSYVRKEILVEQHPEWHSAAELSGPKTTPVRSRIIIAAIQDSAPDLTGDRAIKFKNAIKLILKNSIQTCESSL